MTALVGINCSDGVVIGADSSATLSNRGFRTIEERSEKLVIINNRVIIAGTGAVGLGQRFEEAAKSIFRKPEILKEDRNLSHVEVSKQVAAAAIEDFRQTFAPGGQFGALIAFPWRNKSYLYEYDVETLQPEHKKDIWYCSMGSTQPMTDPFLAFIREVFWAEGQPTIRDGIFAATWTLDHAIKLNPGGVNGPVRIAVLEEASKQARILDDEELSEPRDYIENAKKALRDSWVVGQGSDDNTPDVPRPN